LEFFRREIASRVEGVLAAIAKREQDVAQIAENIEKRLADTYAVLAPYEEMDEGGKGLVEDVTGEIVGQRLITASKEAVPITHTIGNLFTDLARRDESEYGPLPILELEVSAAALVSAQPPAVGTSWFVGEY